MMRRVRIALAIAAILALGAACPGLAQPPDDGGLIVGEYAIDGPSVEGPEAPLPELAQFPAADGIDVDLQADALEQFDVEARPIAPAADRAPIHNALSISGLPLIETDVNEPSEGCVFLGLKGSYVSDVANALARINEIRLEACQEGVDNPNQPGTPLTPEDYVPIRWSSDLEYIARLRAAEAAVTLAHERLTDKHIFYLTSPSGISSWGEVIAWNWSSGVIMGINQWYAEKAYWVEKTPGAVTGHYTQMIDPTNKYIGLGTFCSDAVWYTNTTVGEFSHYDGLDETPMAFSGPCIQKLEVDSGRIDGGMLLGVMSGVRGDTSALALAASVKDCALLALDDVTWSSASPGVATVDAGGTVTAASCGTARITAGSSSGIAASADFTVDHIEQTLPAVAATCTQTGLTEGAMCSACGEILTAQAVVPAKGHSGVVDYAVAASCTKTGLTEGSHCCVCGAVLKAQKTVPAKGHSAVVDYAVAASCTETGLTEGSHCWVCNAVLKAQKTIPAKGHTAVVDRAVEASCTETGLTEGSHCSVCNAVFVAQQVIPARGHSPVVDRAVEASCTETGLTEGSHCSVCDLVIVARKVVPAKGHTAVVDRAVAASCTETGLTEGSHCSVCDAVIKAQKTVPAKGHAYGGWTVTKQPTVFRKGARRRTCGVCGARQTKALPALEAKLKLSRKSVKLAKTKSGSVSVTLARGDTFTAKSSNRKIAQVSARDGGLVITARKKAGKATVTVRTKSGLKANIAVVVAKAKTKKLTCKSVTVKKGKKVTLKPKVSPAWSDDPVTFKSADTRIATVSSKGVVKGVHRGKTTITVRSGKKSVKVKVTVK